MPQVVVDVCDYASVDASGKTNIIGGGVGVIGVDPTTGASASFAVAVLVVLPGSDAGRHLQVDVRLLGPGRKVVTVGTARGGQPVELKRELTLEPAVVNGERIEGDPLPLRIRLLTNFPTGLPLEPDTIYTWQVKVDGRTSRGWDYLFYASAAPVVR